MSKGVWVSINKFKEGQKVKVIRTGEISKIYFINNDDINENGSSIRCYELENKHYYTVQDLELVEDEEIEELEISLLEYRYTLTDIQNKLNEEIIKNQNKINELVKAVNEMRNEK